MRRLPPYLFLLLLVTLVAAYVHAQGTPPPSPLVLLSRDTRRPIPTVLQSGQELIALDDVASLFQVTVREDSLAGGVVVSYKGRTVLASMEQPMASVNGRLVALPAPATRAGRRWLVPVEFLSRALAPIYDAKIELRKPSRLLIVGDIRVPRVTARIDAAGPPARVSIDIAPPAAATVTHDAFRALVRIEADAIDFTGPAAGTGLIDQIRIGEPPTVIVVQLRGAGSMSVSTIASESSTRVRLDVNPPATAASPPSPVPPPPPLPPPVTDPIPPVGAPRAAIETIVIDPGHGGDDTGVTGPGGMIEKNLTLDVARRVRSLIEARLGLRVVLTRDEDRRVELDERAAVANNSKADLFLSLHANAALVRAVSGAEVFYLAVDEEVEAAGRAAEAESISLPVVGGGTRAVDVLRWDMAQGRHVTASQVLARMLEEELGTRIVMGPRPVQRAPLRVLVGANMPAVLLEMAYLSNASDEKRAATVEFQTSLTQAVYETVLRFRAYLEAQP